MKRKFSYSMKEMNYRLLMMGRPIWKYIGISTLASTLGALSHMGLMGFGALWLLAAAGFSDGAGIYAALTAVCAVLIAVCRYLEGVFSHLGAYGILAKMRVHLFNAIDRIAPAYLIGRETGDVMNIAVSDIETLEYFFAHTIGPMFTVILLPTTTVVIAWCVNPLYALVLIPIYLIISVVLPLVALKAGRGIGMRYRERLGDLKSKILESVYSCLLYTSNLILKNRSIGRLARRLLAFGICIFLVVPASVKLSDLIDNTYHAQIEMTLEEAKGTQKILESESGEGAEVQQRNSGAQTGQFSDQLENKGTGVAGLWEKAKGALESAKETATSVVENVTLSSEELLQKIEHSLSRFAEAIAVMLITSCVIPVLVLLVFFWLIKVFLDLDMSFLLYTSSDFHPDTLPHLRLMR